MEQVASVRKRWPVEDFQAKRRIGAIWTLHTRLEDFQFAHSRGYGPDARKLLRRVRTDLDAFTASEIDFLENHGYSLADAALRSRAPALRPNLAAPFRWPNEEWCDDGQLSEALKATHLETYHAGRPPVPNRPHATLTRCRSGPYSRPSVACAGPPHRLQWLPQALLRPSRVQGYYTSFAAERLSPAARERVRQEAGSARRAGRIKTANSYPNQLDVPSPAEVTVLTVTGRRSGARPEHRQTQTGRQSMSSKQNTPAAPSTVPQTLKIGSRVHCTDDHVEGRIVWANGVSVKIRWDDGEQVTWRRDSLAGRAIKILAVADDEEEPALLSASPSVPATPEQGDRTEPPQAGLETAPAPTEPTMDQTATPAPEPPPAEPAAAVAEPLDVQTDPASGEPAQPSAKPKRQRQAPAEPKEKKLSALDAAAKVLGEAGQPMGCKELIGAKAAKGYWASPAGRTPGKDPAPRSSES